jgi:hypothetical protein
MKEETIRRKYLWEAAIMLAFARLAIRFVPAVRIFAWAARPPKVICRFAEDEVGWISWAVETIGTKQWMRAVCLPQALAAQTMLRRRGIASSLCLGVSREGDTLLAHAWVEIRGKVILGGRGVQSFTRLARFGGERA